MGVPAWFVPARSTRLASIQGQRFRFQTVQLPFPKRLSVGAPLDGNHSRKSSLEQVPEPRRGQVEGRWEDDQHSKARVLQSRLSPPKMFCYEWESQDGLGLFRPATGHRRWGADWVHVGHSHDGNALGGRWRRVGSRNFEVVRSDRLRHLSRPPHSRRTSHVGWSHPYESDAHRVLSYRLDAP